MADSSAAKQAVEEMVLEFASPTACLSPDLAQRMAALVETCKQFMVRKTKAFVASAEHRPLLVSYGSDGAPLITREYWQHKAGGNRVVHRHGGASLEYLIQRSFFLYRKCGETYMHTLFAEPIPLTHGKASMQIFSCGRVFSPPYVERGTKVLLYITIVSTAQGTAR